jgi:hypothetical protein
MPLLRYKTGDVCHIHRRQALQLWAQNTTPGAGNWKEESDCDQDTRAPRFSLSSIYEVLNAQSE